MVSVYLSTGAGEPAPYQPKHSGNAKLCGPQHSAGNTCPKPAPISHWSDSPMSPYSLPRPVNPPTPPPHGPRPGPLTPIPPGNPTPPPSPRRGVSNEAAGFVVTAALLSAFQRISLPVAADCAGGHARAPTARDRHGHLYDRATPSIAIVSC